MYTSIVVPLDGSAFGKRALPLALALARRSDAAVHLVHVHEPILEAWNQPPEVTQVYDQLRQQMRTDVTALAAQLTREASLEVDAEFLDGPIVPTLQRFLAARPADLVVMMTHGRGGLRRAWLGSVADGLVRQSPVPVLLVRPGAEWPGKLSEPLFRRVLVPLDGSTEAEELLNHAVHLGAPDATVYTLLTILGPTPSLLYPGPVPALPAGASLPESQRKAALAYLTRVADELRDAGVAVETRVIVHEQTAQGILEQMDALQADAIALSTHGRGGAARLLLGSVADKVLRGTSVPVLVYRPERVRTASRAATPERGHSGIVVARDAPAPLKPAASDPLGAARAL